MLAFISADFSYAKFTSQKSLNASSRVAQIVIDVVETDTTTETDLLYKTTTYEYNFTVTNKKDENISEVVIEYYITVDDYDKNYIEETGVNAYKLYRIENDNTRTLVSIQNGTTLQPVTLGTVASGTINEDTHNYVLVYYPISTTSGANGEFMFSINISASQVGDQE